MLDLGYPGDGHAHGGDDLLWPRAGSLQVSASWCPRVWTSPNTLWRRAFLRSGPSVRPLARAIAAADSGSGRLRGWEMSPFK